MQQAGDRGGVVMQKLFLFLLVLLGVWYVRKALGRAGEQAASHDRPVHSGGQTPHAENIRECHHCGVLIPESEGVMMNGDFFCSSEHAAAAGRRES